MKKNRKRNKLIYGLGASILASVPIGSVLSCGTNTTPPPININMDKITSVKELIQILNNHMHFISKRPSTLIGKISEKNPGGYPLSTSQYKEIASGVITDITFKLSYGNKSQIFTTKFNSYTETVKKSINDMLSNPSSWTGTQASNELNLSDSKSRIFKQLEGGANFVSYVANITYLIGIQAEGYLSLPQKAWDAYKNELTEWTNFTWLLKNSSVFKAWIHAHSKSYLQPKYGTSNLVQISDLIDPTTSKNKDITNGINFDAPGAAGLLQTSPPKQKDKLSNLGLQFDYMIQDLYKFK